MDIIVISQIVGIVLIVCWVAKQVGIKSNLIPLLAIILGGAGAIILGGTEWLNALYGVFTGLATTLGYREVKASLE